MARDRRIWVALVDGNGARLMSPGKVNISPDSDVDDVKQAVEAMYRGSALERITRTDLSVYADQAAFVRNDAPLAADARVEGYGEHLANAILVVSPFTSNKRQRWEDVETHEVVESPVSVFSNDAWREFDSSAKPKLSGKPPDLPIAEPAEGCITTFMDLKTKVQVVCLPHRLPKSAVMKSHIVLIRPFTVKMIIAMAACTDSHIAVVGNAGIGKSYMQLVILLWWARPELRPVVGNGDGAATLAKFFDGIDAIARVELGDITIRADLYFKHEQAHYGIDNLTQVLPSSLNSMSTLLLYEPRSSPKAIMDCGISDGHLWATVSPLEDRYKEFAKTGGALKYMECPYEDELVFMATVMEKCVRSELKPLYEESLVRKRIRIYGLYQRVVLPTSAGVLKADDDAKERELAALTLEKLQKSWFIAEKRTVGMMEISHRILRISPELDEKFDSYTLKPANDLVVETLGNLLFQIDVQQLKSQLIAYVANPTNPSVSPAIKGSMPITLEIFFIKYAAAHDIKGHWEDWEVATTMFTAKPKPKSLRSRRSRKSVDWTPKWEAFSLNVNQINRSKLPTYADIVAAPTSIFYMNDPAYPFVDCFWCDDDKMAVHAGQVTMSENGHPKGIGTFNTMKKNIGIPDGVKLVVNYITLPYQADRYANGSRSYFFSDDNDVGITEIQRTVDFRVIKMSLR
ncbi:hypothetical protein DYB30_013189 [Aphanomyces astaci]|uniref:Uncharacterized protein n=2 Tax=Aphanomyces astaci TaxID=112090 RepID=A0A397DZL6_APHAT|nr:hypothetical protein DYB30_013189 [Aphanomyces astaci]RHZ29194.1 hypothetical protein DYB26_014263 [Aphanomyces astaci]